MTILRRGFELLKTRPLSDALNIEALESAHRINVPLKYKLFSQLFYLQLTDKGDMLDGGRLISRILYMPEKNPVGDEIFFDELFPLDFSLTTYRENEFWASKGLTQIGGGPPDGGILLRAEGKDRDAIFYNYGHKYVKLANDVFDFFRDVVVYYSEDDHITKKVNTEDLFKKWGEDFWRLGNSKIHSRHERYNQDWSQNELL
ncbi:hypothetical protein KK083_26355 [Fulvivirgaceae bacterium PWU4]|uniref:SMI1/KNR4 family protein n=1 Tax=Chryseosolibacter histidini TaxID=2782349 RepID=A0AAP2DSV3_9BACT|nr:hypothetical protein [Chryseosolibacter histidini]MBT1700437.1 hypothetical protein [Chryseosolibacter histidini]